MDAITLLNAATLLREQEFRIKKMKSLNTELARENVALNGRVAQLEVEFSRSISVPSEMSGASNPNQPEVGQTYPKYFQLPKSDARRNKMTPGAEKMAYISPTIPGYSATKLNRSFDKRNNEILGQTLSCAPSFFDQLHQRLSPNDLHSLLVMIKALNEYKLSLEDATRQAEQLLGASNMDIFSGFVRLLEPS